MSQSDTYIPHETAMQQAWRFMLGNTRRLNTAQGNAVSVCDAGKLNIGPGPDFRDARLRIDGDEWVGCVEMHRHASDWHRHGHDGDAAYRNVILHVVGCDDCRITREDGTEIPQAVMRVAPGFVEMFNGLLNEPHYVLPMCGRSLPAVADIFKTDWLTALAFERMQRKADDVAAILRATAGDWLQTAFVTLARGLGFGVNADNMERMARSVPYKILLRHSDDLDAVEAILFGQAGLLDTASPADAHEAQLVNEYRFYAHKYGLTPIDNPVWQTNARNMANTPWRRIALLARLVCRHGSDLGSILSENTDIEFFRSVMNIDMSDYWAYAFAFGRTGGSRMAALGRQSRDLLIINVLAPLIYCRGLASGRPELLDGAIRLWERVDGERNSITRGFEEHGIPADNAFTSQALIQLHRGYCERRRCPDCRLGHRILSSFVSLGDR